MNNKLISIRIADSLLKEAESIASDDGFSNVQEFIRDSVRTVIQTRKRENAVLELRKLYGSAKNPKILSKKELSMLIKKEYNISE